MGNQKFGDKTLAQPWILPIVIVSGLASAYAIPWNYSNVSIYTIAATLIPLIAQFVLASLTSVFAFLGKKVWLHLLISTTALALLNSFLFGLDFWGITLPNLPKYLIILTSISLIPTVIWGRKKALYSAPNSTNFESIADSKDW
jgi:hypothetical protein